MRRLLFILSLLCLHSLHAQQWTIYDTTNSPLPDNQVQAIAIDAQNVKWIGTSKGLARLSGSQWTVYPSPAIFSLAIDKKGIIWVGTNEGLRSFDGKDWKEYLPGKMVNKLAYDATRNLLWISIEKALVKYDGNTFTQYDLIFDTYIINSLTIDKNGLVWIGAFDTFQFNGRLLSFDSTNWTHTKLDSHELYSTFPYSLTVDADNTLWMGTGGTTGGVLVRIKNNEWKIYDRLTSEHIKGGNALLLHKGQLWAAANGLTFFDGKQWTGFDRFNSPLPDDYTYALAADRQGGIWTGTIRGGLVVYNEETQLALINYPNPFSNSTTIQYDLPQNGHVQLSIYNMQGQLIKILENANKQAGRYTLSFNDQAGIYFCKFIFNGRQLTRKLVKL